jgi:hypothetical protein
MQQVAHLNKNLESISCQELILSREGEFGSGGVVLRSRFNYPTPEHIIVRVNRVFMSWYHITFQGLSFRARAFCQANIMSINPPLLYCADLGSEQRACMTERGQLHPYTFPRD